MRITTCSMSVNCEQAAGVGGVTTVPVPAPPPQPCKVNAATSANAVAAPTFKSSRLVRFPMLCKVGCARQHKGLSGVRTTGSIVVVNELLNNRATPQGTTGPACRRTSNDPAPLLLERRFPIADTTADDHQTSKPKQGREVPA